MLVLGIDPGLAIVGWGVLNYERNRFTPVAFGSLQTPANTPTEQRLAILFEDMDGLLEKYHPDCMSVEELFFNNNITTGIRVAEARGVLLLAAARRNVPIFEYTPSQVKQAVVGYGKAEKGQVISMVTTILKLSAPPKPDDTADALALAICHAHSSGSRLADYFNK